MERFQKINKMLHLVYPETLNKLVVANVPGVFGVMFNIFRPLSARNPPPSMSFFGPVAHCIVAVARRLPLTSNYPVLSCVLRSAQKNAEEDRHTGRG